MADAEPFDEVRIGQWVGRRRPVGPGESLLDPGQAPEGEFWRGLEIQLQKVAHQNCTICVRKWLGQPSGKAIAIGGLLLSAALCGCVSVGAPEKEGQLSAAGFMRLQADLPQKMAKLQALPQDTLVDAPRKGGNAYIFADAAGCNCAFVGN